MLTSSGGDSFHKIFSNKKALVGTINLKVDARAYCFDLEILASYLRCVFWLEKQIPSLFS